MEARIVSIFIGSAKSKTLAFLAAQHSLYMKDLRAEYGYPKWVWMYRNEKQVGPAWFVNYYIRPWCDDDYIDPL